MKLRFSFSPQASAFTRQLKNWNDQEFLGWLCRNGIPIGSAVVSEFIMTRDAREQKLKPKQSPKGREVFIDG